MRRPKIESLIAFEIESRENSASQPSEGCSKQLSDGVLDDDAAVKIVGDGGVAERECKIVSQTDETSDRKVALSALPSEDETSERGSPSDIALSPAIADAEYHEPLDSVLANSDITASPPLPEVESVEQLAPTADPCFAPSREVEDQEPRIPAPNPLPELEPASALVTSLPPLSDQGPTEASGASAALHSEAVTPPIASQQPYSYPISCNPYPFDL